MFSASSGVLISRIGQYRTLIQVSFAIFALGMGLMIQLRSTSSTYVLTGVVLYIADPLYRAEKVLYPFVCSIGVGCLFQVCGASDTLILRFKHSPGPTCGPSGCYAT